MRAWIMTPLVMFSFAVGANDLQSSGEPGLSINNDRMSANLDGRALEGVLSELAKRSGIRVFVNGSAGGEVVSAHFSELSMDEGLKNLLQGKNYTVRYERTNDGMQVAELRVSVGYGSGPFTAVPQLPASAAPASVVKGQAVGNSTENLVYEALHAKDPDTRVSALQSLEKASDDKKIAEAVASTLRDGDRHVRSLSLAMVQRGASIEPRRLQEMAQQEPDVKLRAQAWDELLDRSEDETVAKNYLSQAKQDADPGIKAWAERKLQEYQDEEPEQQSKNAATGV